MSAFIIKVKTDNTGTSNNDQFTLPGNSSYSYNFDVDWGDGSPVETINSGSSWTHTFTGGVGTYSVEITENVAGGFPTIRFANGGDKLKILELEQWGTNRWDSFNFSFWGCSNLTITATDHATADTGGVTDFFVAWGNCSSLTSFPLLDTSSGTNFQGAWQYCSSLTSFPLIDTSSGTNFSYAWRYCSSLTSFPLLDTSSGTTFEMAWYNCSSLTSFPLINTSSGTNFSNAWRSCSLTSFPLIDTSQAITLNYTWFGCNSLTSFPAIDTSNATNFFYAWANCTSLSSFPYIDTSNGVFFGSTWRSTAITSFPLIDTSSGTDFRGAWMDCGSLTSFPTLDFRNMLLGADAFLNVTLDTASYDAILEKSFLNNTNNSVTFHGGNSKYARSGLAARDILTAAPRSWTITDGGYDSVYDPLGGVKGWWCPSLDTAGNGTTTLTDLSGNGNNGTLTNMDAATDWVADTDSGGVRAITLDGIDDFITMGQCNDLEPSSGDFSTMLWCKIITAVGNDGLWNHGSYTQGWNWTFGGSAGGNNTIIVNTTIKQGSPKISGEWVLLGFSKTGTNLTTYVNGVQANAWSDLPATVSPTTADFVIGKDGLNAGRETEVSVDGCAFWNRVITPDEWLQLYNGGRSLNLLTGGIITTIPRFNTNNLSIGYDPLNGGIII